MLRAFGQRNYPCCFHVCARWLGGSRKIPFPAVADRTVISIDVEFLAPFLALYAILECSDITIVKVAGIEFPGLLGDQRLFALELDAFNLLFVEKHISALGVSKAPDDLVEVDRTDARHVPFSYLMRFPAGS